MGIFDGIFNTKPQQLAKDAQVEGLTKGYDLATDALETGNTKTDTDYAAGLLPITKNLETDQAGQTAYADALGVNGDAGYTKALNAFHTGPSYAWELDQGNQNVLRGQSASGQLASGGTNVDLLTYGQGLADKNWQSYIKNLQPFIGASTTNAGAGAALATAQAGTDTTYAGKIADAGWQKETGIGNAIANSELAKTTTNGNIINAGTSAAKTLAAFLPI